MIRTARVLYLTALGLWVGGMATLAFVVAPTLFRAAPSRAVAGTLFGAVLRSFGPVQIALGGIAAVALVVLMQGGELRRRSGFLRLSALLLMLLLSCNAQFILGPAIERERAAVPNFDSLPPGVPARARFDSLHKWSVWLGSVTLLTGAVLLARSAATLKSTDAA
jgi:hypothetical protein